MKWFLDWAAENKGLFTGLVIGLAIAILFLTIGFWATILIIVCTSAGAYLGGHPEVRGRIADFFKRLFRESENRYD